ncbi:TIR domain-containing protein [Streptomyces sp. CG 926]|uniref:TIR domain-containing protein n=1 Tax=Streptomyces sp. CG 926 TaxID=1882405 RepID=UPI000D6CAEDA|nr:TIR domain-containing protein [Streptomyces sp. CG 926]PWK65226.1 TIR domain-containing protein [Streptomyces sp. CG 926]
MPDEGLPAAATEDAGPAAPVVEDYDAFISYTHKPDHAMAKAIQRGLLSLGRKAWRAPSLRVFRDEETLYNTGNLPTTLQRHLDRSRYLILVASPASAEAPYVRTELAYWLANKPCERILIAVAGGGISWPQQNTDFDWTESTALANDVFAGKFTETPLWSDFRGLTDKKGQPLTLRDDRFLDQIAKLGARLHGVQKEQLVSIERRNQRNALRLAWSVAALLLALAVTAGLLYFEADEQRKEAELRAREATSRRLAALSRTVQGKDGSLQYLLAAQAQRMAATTEARGALFEAAAGSDRQRVLQGTQSLARLVGHEQGVKAVRFSPGGARAGTVDGLGAVRVWATGAAGDPVAVPGLKEPRLTFTADGEFVVSDGSRLQWRDAVSGAVRENRDLGFVPAHIEWLGSGRTVLAAGPDGTVVAARPDGGTDRAPDSGSSAVTFLGSPAHAEVAVVATADGAVTVRRKKDLAVEARWKLDPGAGRPVAVSADGSRIAVLDDAARQPARDAVGVPVVSVRSTKDGKQVGLVRTSEYYIPKDAAFIGGSSRVVVVTSGGVDGAPGQLLTADPAKDEPATSPGVAVPTTAFTVRSSDDGRRVLVGGGDPTAYVNAIGPQDADFGASVLPEGITPVLPLSVAGATGRIVVRQKGEVGFADIGTGKPGATVKTTMVTAGERAAISTNGRWLITPTGDVFDLQDPAAPERTGQIPKPVGGLDFDGSGDRVAYVAGPEDLVVADLPSLAVQHGSAGRRLCSASPCQAVVALSPDGQLLAVRTESENGTSGKLPPGADPADSPADYGRTPLVLISLRDGWNVRAVLDLAEPGPVEFQDDRTLLVQAGTSLLTVDAAAPTKPPVTRSADQQGAWSFGAGRADKDLAIAGQCKVSLTDPLTWGEIATVPYDGVHTDGGCDAAFAAWAGETLLTHDGGDCYQPASGECPLRRWNTRAEQLVPRVCALAARNLTAGEWSQYLPDWPYERTCPEFGKPSASTSVAPAAGAGSATPVAPGPGSPTDSSPGPAASSATPTRTAAPEPTRTPPTAPSGESAGAHPPGSVPTGTGGCTPGRSELYRCTVGKRDGAPYQDTPSGKPLEGTVTQGEHPFRCQKRGPAHTYGAFHNDWWARVVLREATGDGGWVNAVYLSGGANDEPVPGLPVCTTG